MHVMLGTEREHKSKKREGRKYTDGGGKQMKDGSGEIFTFRDVKEKKESHEWS